MPDPIRTVGELIGALSALDPKLPVLVDAAVEGFTAPAISVTEVEQWSGLPGGFGPYLTPEHAAVDVDHCFGRYDWQGRPARAGGPFTAVVLRRIGGEPVPWPITVVEPRGGTVLRISHADNTIADHDLARLVGRGGVFASFTAATIAAAQLIDGTIGWILPDGSVVDLAPDAIWDHTRGRCGGGGCQGWSPAETVVVRLP